MEPWQKHEKHEKDILETLREEDCLDSKNRIRRWRGAKVWSNLHAKGHDSVGFDTCSCSK